MGHLKKETEDLITAGKDQALRTNVIKANIEHKRVSALRRMCGKRQESVEQNTQHVAAASFAQRGNKKRQFDTLAQVVQ